MSEEILILDSPLKEKIYGGTKIRELFGLAGDSDKKIGEYWAISAHGNGPSVVKGGQLEGITLQQVWQEHPELFHDDSERFPLLVKINEITGPVSVQVHPDNQYALEHENDLGKAEFCIFLDVEEGTKVIRGHKAQTREELKDAAETGNLDSLLIRKPVRTGDFVYTPPGVIHGVEGRMLMAEIQQSSDVTYRLYDYDNKDEDGNPRQLHIPQALDVTLIPHSEPEAAIREIKSGIEYADNQYFGIRRYANPGHLKLENSSYTLGLVLAGSGTVKTVNSVAELKPGTPFIVTALSNSFELSGSMDILVITPGRKDA